jgi:hypothetical protein
VNIWGIPGHAIVALFRLGEERLSEPLLWRGADDTPRQDSHSTVYLYRIGTWPRRNGNSNVNFTLNDCTHPLKIDVVFARMFLY